MLNLLVPEFEGITESETLPEGLGKWFASMDGGRRDSLRSPYAVLPAQRGSHSGTEKQSHRSVS
jgi:hypothetical protein